MKHIARICIGCAALAFLLGTAPHRRGARIGSFKLDVTPGPYVSGSHLDVPVAGAGAAYTLSVIGPGAIDGSAFIAPDVTAATTTALIGALPGAVAFARLQIVPPPRSGRGLIAVATYRDGIALHDPRTFALLGYVPIGGAPGDVAFARDGDLVAPNTDGETLTRIVRKPWKLQQTPGVLEGNEVLVDENTRDVFVSDRDAEGAGAVTRIDSAGAVRRVATGQTAEGLALDSKRNRLYVGNVNDQTVAIVDPRTMRVLGKIPSVPRTFGIALDGSGNRLFVVSNSSPSMRAGGSVATIDLGLRYPRITVRSARMDFPLGIAFEARRDRLFVTDEAADAVYVLNASTLRAERAPLRTCQTPWRPRIAGGRLYVPCARANRVDVFDLSSLREVPNAPFATGGFPLSVAQWP